MPKLDLKKELKSLYMPSTKEVSMVDVGPANFLMIDGKGDPNKSLDYQAAVEALFSVSYTLKFMVKKAGGIDFVVMPLEGLWWTEGPGFDAEHKDRWFWTAMIRQPDFITKPQYQQAIADAARKKELPAISKMRFEKFAEGRAAQIMHIGPFADEGPTIEKVHRLIEAGGHKLSGKHHEIYLSDYRKTASAKLKTVVRQPFR